MSGQPKTNKQNTADHSTSASASASASASSPACVSSPVSASLSLSFARSASRVFIERTRTKKAIQKISDDLHKLLGESGPHAPPGFSPPVDLFVSIEVACCRLLGGAGEERRRADEANKRANKHMERGGSLVSRLAQQEDANHALALSFHSINSSNEAQRQRRHTLSQTVKDKLQRIQDIQLRNEAISKEIEKRSIQGQTS